MILIEEGYPLGECMYEWPDLEMAECFFGAPYFWKIRVAREWKEWAKTPPKAI